MSDTVKIMIEIPGPFTLRMEFTLTKDGKEDVGNLISEGCNKCTKSFDTLPDAIQWLRQNIEEKL